MPFSALASLRGRRPSEAHGQRPRGLIHRTVTPWLQTVSHHACTHPIYTITAVVVICSALYAHLLDSGFFHPRPSSPSDHVDWSVLSAGSRRLHLTPDGPQTRWVLDADSISDPDAARRPNEEDLALVTMVFPPYSAAGVSSSHGPPPLAHVLASVSEHNKIQHLPSTMSADPSQVFAMPVNQVVRFLDGVKRLAPSGDDDRASSIADESDDEIEHPMWVAGLSGTPPRGTGILDWFRTAWTAFIDLVRRAETLDIVIMALGYLSMYLTFASLFLSMKRMGSNGWLATTVLFSSAFAFLCGIIVTMHLGVPEDIVLLSEGVPFLVVTIGFEKPIVLTQAVLSAAIQGKTSGPGDAPITIHAAVQRAVRERGSDLVRDYMMEILVLCIGAASGIQGGLRQFCFLAAWTLFFDAILLFTFYTAILTIKLEINRIKRHVALRKALEEEGVSRRVAETVASSNDWPRDDMFSGGTCSGVFGLTAKDSSVPRFKLWMVGGFVAINLLHLFSVPFRAGHHHLPVTTASLSSVVTPPPLDPFKVAGAGLDRLYDRALAAHRPLTVTVVSPIKYELQHPSAAASDADGVPFDGALFDGNLSQGVLSVVRGRVVQSLLKSFEDPVLSKWVIVVLAISLALNGYLFNAARWSIVPDTEPSRPVSPSPRERAKQNGYAVAPMGPTPAPARRETPNGADGPLRGREECEEILRDKQAFRLRDDEIVELSLRGKIPGYALEKTLGDKTRAVRIRRAIVSRTPDTAELSAGLNHSKLPYEHFDYDRVHGACCENVIGYMPLPVGVAGPLIIDGRHYFLPMATTEGVLVASTSRGCKAINAGGGANTVLVADGMTRGPCIGFETLKRAAAAKVWLDSPEGARTMRDAFDATSRFARLQQLKSTIAGTYVYVRFKTTTGDAMGMNMISKGVEAALGVMARDAGFDDMAIISVSGNYCTDKKPAAINWIDGRGKSVVAEAVIPGDVVRSILKSDVDALVELNVSKNLIGSAMAGSIGGFNAHAANIVTALFLATGQDPAQNVESSNCITVMKKCVPPDNHLPPPLPLFPLLTLFSPRSLRGNLHISVSMPSIEVGTIGGGTVLEPQAAMLDLLGVRGPDMAVPGNHARSLARIVAAGVLAGELSLAGALAAGHLVRAHMQHNRTPGGGASGASTPSTAAVARGGLLMSGLEGKAKVR